MSQRPSESRRSPAISPRTVQAQSVSSRSPRQSTGVNLSTGANVFSEGGHTGQATAASMGFRHQPIQPRSSPVADQTPSRTLGVHSILNPSQPDVLREQNALSQQESTASSFSPRRSIPTSLHVPTSTSPRSRKRLDPAFQSNDGPSIHAGRSGRRLLTPISPALRASSLGPRVNLVSDSRASLQSPFNAPGEAGRYYTAEPGQSLDSDIPPLPVSVITGRSPISLPHPSDAPAAQPRLPATSYSQALGPVSHVTSQKQSPNTSQPPYSHIHHASPMDRYGVSPAPQPNYPGQGPHGPYPPISQSPSVTESHYGMGQGYQITLETNQGHMTIPVELDLQQASKVADEKRKRNAGASARFRERRKQKEKEAAHSIATLENEIRDLQEQRDHYRDERNFFRDCARTTPDFDQLPRRPTTPQPRQPLPLPKTSSEGGLSPESEHTTELPQRNTRRRRTGDYDPAFVSAQPSASPMLPPQLPIQPPYQTQPPLPPMQSSYHDLRAGPPSLPPPVGLPMSRSQSYENLRENPRPPNNLYDRSWNPGR